MTQVASFCFEASHGCSLWPWTALSQSPSVAGSNAAAARAELYTCRNDRRESGNAFNHPVQQAGEGVGGIIHQLALATRTCRSRNHQDKTMRLGRKVEIKAICSNTGWATVWCPVATRPHEFSIISSDNAHARSRFFGMLYIDPPPPQKKNKKQEAT